MNWHDIEALYEPTLTTRWMATNWALSGLARQLNERQEEVALEIAELGLKKEAAAAHLRNDKALQGLRAQCIHWNHERISINIARQKWRRQLDIDWAREIALATSTFGAISDPKNAHHFTVEAALQGFRRIPKEET